MIQLILLLLLTIGIEGNSNHDQHLDVVCKDINIQEDFSGDFKDYENCTVVEGSVRIILSDDCDPDFYRSIRFPKLKEIIGYLFVYRIFMLTSLGEVFPSLVVIRGNILFHDYALIVYQMMDLQVLGLGNLTNILKGGVMIQKNPKLCYIDTVDWEEITGSADVKYHFVENRLNVHCPHNCLKNCPLIKKGRSEQRFCWSSSQCQKKCRQKCEDQTCSYQGSCCHSECLGGCTGNFSVDCISCKNVVYGGRCMKKCPFSTYLYMSWRCITEDECRKIQNKYGNDSSQIYWKPFEGNCIPECPEGYAEQELDKHSCKKCRGLCPKTCPETVVDSVESARKLRGCTYINGSLTIQIKGYNVVKELEENLGAIKEIRNYLKIARCYSIVSLNFLKNLTVIHGDKVTSRGYGFIVLDNVNLEDLWDWKNRREKLRIKNGTLSFHFNPKLCFVKIEEMEKHTDAPGWSNISLVSNGHRIACQIKMINISLQRSSSEIAVIAVTDYRLVLSDPRSLLSYIAYYRKAPFQNVTIYGGRDACGRDSWKTVDIEEENDEGNKAEPNSKQHVPGFLKEDNINFILTNLKPYTQYAVYVRTLTVASGQEAAYSPIMYFTTKPDTPSPPTDLKAQVKSDGSVEVKWNPSKRPNGIVTRYKVYVVKEYDPVEFISQRNYCEESLILSDVKKQLEEFGATTTTPIIPTVNTSIVKKIPIEKECCNCTELSIIGEEEAEHRMQFEDYLQNTAFIKIKNRRFFVRRQATTNSSFTNYRSNNSSEMVDSTEPFNSSILVDPSVPVNLSTLTSTSVPLNSNVQVDSSMVMNSSAVANLSVPVNSSEPVPPNRTLYFSLRGETVLITPILHHFTEYTFKVRACQDKSAGAEVPCSAEAITTIRTARNNYADDINCTSIKIEVGNATSGIVYVKWEEPSDPNGLLVSHHIEYKNMDSKNDKAIPICITHQKFQAYGGYQLSELSAGNYSLRIRATSLAGNGNWTSPVYFYIPESKSVLTKEHVVIIIVCCLGFMAVCVFIGGWFIYKRKTSIPEGILYTSVNPEYISAALVYEPDEWEVDREKISLLRELGQGSFGMVYEGEARDIIPGKPVTKCAIKTVNESASAREKIEFLQEASVMKAFNCCHVVKLLGVVSKGQPVLVVMELMACGDLKTYLRSHRPEENPDSQPPTLKQTLQMALQIADGMAYLAAKKFVHRDLAARNCMVAEDLTVKIGDFGMTRDIYETDYYRKGGKGLLPVRWMAPESLQDGIFTSQSDVWSYGVVIWEMTTLASQPYQGLSNEQVLKYVMHGGIMEKPENCPEILFGLMMRCWNYSPPKRPTFITIIEELIQHVLTPQFQKESFYFSYSEALLPESPSNENLLTNRFDTEMNLQYFPGAIVQENKQNEEAGPSEGLEGHNRNSSEMLQEQVNTSEGSKGSKISDASNGHIYFRTNRTTEC